MRRPHLTLPDPLARLARRWMGLHARPEPWGGVVALSRPAMLVYVDRPFMRRLGQADEALWRATDADGSDHHTAPVEVHWTLSQRCDQGCAGCYTRSVPEAPAFDLSRLEATADALARAGVFHVALGGGEPLADPHVLDVARALKTRGIQPSTTTSGAPVTETLAQQLGDFAQINVSIDGVGADYTRVRGHDRFAMADAALKRLQRHGVRAGINAVLTRQTFDALPRLMAYARRQRVVELELLRLKPTGRGRAVYDDLKLTPAQGEALLPTVLRLARRHRLRVKMDCSLAPFICHHDPDPEVMRFFRIAGCEAGDSLAALDPAGRLSGCSFLKATSGPAAEALSARWATDPDLQRWRDYRHQPPAPCDTCRYVSLCNGGCRAVAAGVTGDVMQPDPECPRVRRMAANGDQ